METRKKGLSVALLLLVAFFLSSSPASAASYDWSSAQKVTDPEGDTTYPGRDILAAYQSYNNGYLYFRIDLASAPSSTFPPGYANTYGLYIDSKAGGAESTDMYVPGMLSGIDFIVSSNVELTGSEILAWDPGSNRWNGTKFKDYDSDLIFQHSEDSGTTLEWRVKDGEGSKHIGDSFTWWAATMLPGEGAAKVTYDLTSDPLTNATVTPIPSAVWLLGSGIIGLIGLQRRRARRG